MSDVVSTITLKVDSSQAKTALADLTSAMTALKAGLAGLGTLTDGYKQQQVEIQTLKTQIRELTSGIASGAREMESSVKRSGQVWAGYRTSIDGVTYSYKELSKMTKEQVASSISAAEASKKEMAERKLGLQQVKAEVLDLARAERIAADARAQVPQTVAKGRTLQNLAGYGRVDVFPARDAGLSSYYAKMEADSLAAAKAMTSASRINRSATSSEIQSAVAAITAANPEVKKLGQYYSELEQKSNAVAESHRKSAEATSRFSEAQKVAHSAVRGLAGGLGALFLSYGQYAAVMAAVYGSVKLVTSSISKGMDLNYDAQFAAALSDKTKNNADTLKLKDSILAQLPDTVKDIPYTTNEAAQALRNMAQAGVDVEQGLKLIPSAAKAAIMGETELADAAKDIISVMEVFNLKSSNPDQFAKNFQKVGDIAATVASNTSASFSEVMQSFKSATGVANLYKIKIEEVAATVDVLGKAGIKGTQAGTFSRNFISNLYNAQSEAAKAIKETLGFSAFDSNGKMKDYVTVVNELFSALSKLNDKGLSQAFEKLFNERSTRPAGQLLDSFKELALRVNALRESEGAVDSFVAKLSGAAKIEWQNALAKGSDLLATSLKDTEGAIADLATSFKDFVTDEGVREGLQTLIKLVAALGKGAAFAGQVLGNLTSKESTGSDTRAYLQDQAASRDKAAKESGRLVTGKIGGLPQAPVATGRYEYALPSEYAPKPKGKDLNIPDPGAARKAERDAQRILQDDLSSGLKQEQIQLSRELLDIEIDLAAQRINSVEATNQKNVATRASLEIERLWIGAALADAKASGDKVSAAKFENDLLENSEKLRKQDQQALLDLTKARTADLNVVQDTSLAAERYIEDLEFERKTLGKTAAEVAKLRIERERARTEQDLYVKLSRGQITPDQFEAERNANEAKAEAKVTTEESQRTFEWGWKKAYQEYEEASMNAASVARDAFSSATSAMEDLFVSLATTGKASFSDMTNAILADLARIAARQAATGIMSGVSNFLGFEMNAHGNVYSSPSLSAYSNGVYSSPQFFAFAKGAGVFAEAGPEAIMPLSRTSSGDLGVRALGGGVVVNVIESQEKGGTQQQRSGSNGTMVIDVFVAKIKGEISSDIARGSGPIADALENTYGLSRAPGAY